MKCPKCGYLGFETTDRCRHCGYDFSLTVVVEPSVELPLRSPDEREAPLADFAFDRMIGDTASVASEHRAPTATPPPAAPPGESPAEQAGAALPLFTRGRADGDAGPVPTPPPARPPLAVRRATPEVPRRRPPRVVRREQDDLELQLEPVAENQSLDEPYTESGNPTVSNVGTPKLRRVAAALVDVVFLGGINVAVLYLTLAIAGLPLSDALLLPRAPMAAFLMLLNTGYLVTFTAANGQTIGKMLFGVRVIDDAAGRVDIGSAVVRTFGVLLTVVTLGIAYLPVLVSRDGRALHDRLARTRVIKHA